jgi:hypothetical protein
MPVTPISTLKNWFKRGLKPLETQFAAWLDSYWHKSEAIPMESVDGLIDTLNTVGATSNAVMIDCGDYDASTNLFPNAGGTGTAGAIKRGNFFYISVAGVIGGVDIPVGARITAKVNAPGQTLANWYIDY